MITNIFVSLSDELCSRDLLINYINSGLNYTIPDVLYYALG